MYTVAPGTPVLVKLVYFNLTFSFRTLLQPLCLNFYPYENLTMSFLWPFYSFHLSIIKSSEIVLFTLLIRIVLFTVNHIPKSSILDVWLGSAYVSETNSHT